MATIQANPMQADALKPSASLPARQASFEEDDGPLLHERRRCAGPLPRILAFVALLVLLAGAAAIIMLVHSSSQPPFAVPERFSASVDVKPRFWNASDPRYSQVVSGTIHKSTDPAGAWVVSGQATITTHSSQVTTMTLLNNRVYVVVTVDGSVVEQRCMTDVDAPYIEGLQASVSTASPVDSSDLAPAGGALGGCEGVSTWLLVHQQQSYIVCQRGGGDLLQAVGAGFVGTVSNVDKNPSTTPPYSIPTNETSGLPMDCPVVDTAIKFGDGAVATQRRRLRISWLRALLTQLLTGARKSFPVASTAKDAGPTYSDASMKIMTPPGTSPRPARLLRSPATGEVDARLAREAVLSHVAEVTSSPASVLAESRAVRDASFQRVQHKRALSSGQKHGTSSFGQPMTLNPGSKYLTWFHMDDDAVKDCVFVHGAGRASGTGYSRADTEYWGNVHQQLKGCRTTKFLRMDTVNNGWDEPVLQQAFCDYAASKNNMIENTVVFAHGMGNLIIAGALKEALCGFDFTSSVWLELQPAYPVARIAEFARLHFCHFYHLDHSAMSQQLQADLQLCAGAGQLTPAWQSMTYEYAGLADVAEYVRDSVSGSMCGFEPSGLMGSAYADVVSEPWAPNGLVASSPMWSRCWGTSHLNEFYSFPSAPRYMAAVNFLDVTCRNGDGLYDDARMPCFWMDAMIFLAAGADTKR